MILATCLSLQMVHATKYRSQLHYRQKRKQLHSNKLHKQKKKPQH